MIPPGSDNEPARSLAIGDDSNIYNNIDTLFIGYGNGYLRNFTWNVVNNSLVAVKNWEISAHRGNVNTIYVDVNYILTGGEDGILRVWTRLTHELTMQFAAHHKNVFNVFPHVNYFNLIYSCGEDKVLNLFDLKKQKRINNQELRNGIITSIAQRSEPEFEISI
jgi:WD40 repeat protein